MSLNDLVREELQDSYSFWLDEAPSRNVGNPHDVAAKLALAETIAVTSEHYEDDYQELLEYLEAVEELEEEEEEHRLENAEPAEQPEDSGDIEETVEESVEQAMEGVEDDTESEGPLALVSGDANIGPIKEAVNEENLDNAQIDELIEVEESNSDRTTLVDWLEDQKEDDSDIMEIGA